MSTGEMISLGALGVSLILLILTLIRDSRASRRTSTTDAVDLTTTIADIKANTAYTANKVTEVGQELSRMRTDMSELSRRITVCEESTKAGHRRTDEIVVRLGNIENNK